MASTLLESYGKDVSRKLAFRISRRSFMGRLGKGAVAASLGGAGVALLSQSPALAHSCPCSNCGYSIGCNNLTGNNQCPLDTCQCGCWCTNVSSGTCITGIREWCDCCGGCSQGCRCVDGLPTCCYHKEYAGGCGTLNQTHIMCRFHRCVEGFMCERWD